MALWTLIGSIWTVLGLVMLFKRKTGLGMLFLGIGVFHLFIAHA